MDNSSYLIFNPFPVLGLLLVFIFRSYLALVAALASEADFVFIPEDPAVPNWPEKLCKKLEQVFTRRSVIDPLIKLMGMDGILGQGLSFPN